MKKLFSLDARHFDAAPKLTHSSTPFKPCNGAADGRAVIPAVSVETVAVPGKADRKPRIRSGGGLDADECVGTIDSSIVTVSCDEYERRD